MSVTAITPITALPSAPDSAVQSTFDSLANAFVAAQADFVTETNAIATATNANASAAETAATSAEAASAATVAGANYQGLWSGLTGSLDKPASVYHAGEFWGLLADIVDVTASEPGVSADWSSLSPGFSNSVISSSTTISRSPMQHVYIDTASVTLTLPSALTAGDMLIVSWAAFTDCVIARNGHKIAGVAENLNLDSKDNGSVTLLYVNASVGLIITGGV